jgi:hypothetical protein
VVIDSATKISKDTKEMTIVETSGSGHELTQVVNDIRNVRMSDVEIDKSTNEVTIVSRILKRYTVCGMKMSVKLQGSVHITVIGVGVPMVEAIKLQRERKKELE